MPQRIFSSVLLPRPVAAHDAERLARLQLEAHVVEHLQPLDACRFEQPEHVLADRVPADARNRKRLGDAAHLDDGSGHHKYSAARGAKRR